MFVCGFCLVVVVGGSTAQVTPLSYETLEYGSGFSSEQCPEGFVCVAANTLRILTIQRLGEVFNQVS